MLHADCEVSGACHADLLCAQRPTSTAASARLPSTWLPTTKVLHQLLLLSLLSVACGMVDPGTVAPSAKAMHRSFITGSQHAELLCAQRPTSTVSSPRYSAPVLPTVKVPHQLLLCMAHGTTCYETKRFKDVSHRPRCNAQQLLKGPANIMLNTGACSFPPPGLPPPDFPPPR